MFTYKLGRISSEKKVSFRFGDFIAVKSAIMNPPIIGAFGHYDLIDVNDWGMLANDKYGCCAWSDVAHATRLAAKEGGVEIRPTDSEVLQMYSEATGFNPADPNTDQGTEMSVCASYRRQTGVLIGGQRYKTKAYASLNTEDKNEFFRELLAATYFFGSVDIGIVFPKSAGEQFDRAEPWTVVPGSEIDGGHAIPIIGRNKKGNWLTVTWGRLHAITPDFLREYCDEAIVHLSDLPLRPLSPEHYDLDFLNKRLEELR